jgi:hypothetical protein
VDSPNNPNNPVASAEASAGGPQGKRGVLYASTLCIPVTFQEDYDGSNDQILNFDNRCVVVIVIYGL